MSERYRLLVPGLVLMKTGSVRFLTDIRFVLTELEVREPVEEKVPVVSVPEKKEAPVSKGIIFTSMSLQSLFTLGRFGPVRSGPVQF